MNTISCICLTAGRVTQLETAAACFFDQKCDWPTQLVVLNTFPAQELVIASPVYGIEIVNPQQRPLSLGAARNLAILMAAGTHLVTWDDDDEYAPLYLQSFVEHFKSGAEWVWLDKQFYAEAGKIKKIVQGMANTFAFTKAAWQKAGCYKEINVGEDRDFVGRLTTSSPGVRATLRPDEIGYIYNWANRVHHISGQGGDKRGQLTAWRRAELHLERGVKSGTIKAGRVVLVPHVVEKAEQKIADFLRGSAANNRKTDVCLVQLGRYGDIINMLPVARRIAELYGPPALMVSREFADLLDGVSCVIPHVVDFNYSDLLRAMELARKTYPCVVRCQIWGKGHAQERKTEAYNLESWREAGMEKLFHSPDLLPEFDRRDLERERAIFEKLSDGRPLLLLKLHGGLSSPFSGGAKLEAMLREWFQATHQVVELSSLKLERIYDALGLMDRAAALVSIDTAALHLAAASGVPVVVLVNPSPWLGTIPRCNCAARLTYDAAIREPELVARSIEAALNMQKRLSVQPAPCNPTVRRLFHAVERHDEPRNPRKESAWRSWDTLYNRGVVPCHYWEYQRTAADIGDKRALPYFKDVLEFAMRQAADDDIIFFTNDDNLLHPDLIPVLNFHVAVYEACSSQRCEFKSAAPPLDRPLSYFAQHGGPHIGRDLFAFTKSWLTTKWEEIPDFVLGASDWDLALACMIRLENGIKSTRANIGTAFWPAELRRGCVSHVYHPPAWAHPGNANTAPSQKHNRRLFREWADVHCPKLQFTAQNTI